jgi:hypothetical protein
MVYGSENPAVHNTSVKGVDHGFEQHQHGTAGPGGDLWAGARTDAYFGEHNKLSMSGTELIKSFQTAPDLFKKDVLKDGMLEFPALV